jgi:dodecin
MSVSSVSTVTATSPVSFQDAIEQGVSRAQQTLRGIQLVEVISEQASVEKGQIKNYMVELKIVFTLES